MAGERVHQQLGRVLRIFVQKCGRAWSECLPEAAFAYNSTDLSMAPYSPHFIVHLRHPRVKPDVKTMVPTKKKDLRRRLQEAADPEKYVATRRPLADLVYASLLSARREVEEKQLLEEAQNRLPPKQFNPGDLCTVWRPPKDQQLGGKLAYPTIGPYRVLEKRREGREYKLQHLTTGEVDAYATIHMHPYLRDQSFDELDTAQQNEILPKAGTVDPGRRLKSIRDVQEGDFMYMPPLARLFDEGNSNGHLVRVVKCKPRHNSLQVHLLNSRRKGNGRRTGWEFVWAVDGEFGGKGKEKWTPVTDKYKSNFQPWIEEVEYQELLPITIDATLKYSKGKPTGYVIPKAIWQSDIYQTPPPTWAEHSKTLEAKKSNPIPKKGLDGRMRSKNASPSIAFLDQLQTPTSSSRTGKRRRRGRPSPAPDISMMLGQVTKPAVPAAADQELSLIASIHAVYGRAKASWCRPERLR